MVRRGFLHWYLFHLPSIHYLSPQPITGSFTRTPSSKHHLPGQFYYLAAANRKHNQLIFVSITINSPLQFHFRPYRLLIGFIFALIPF